MSVMASKPSRLSGRQYAGTMVRMFIASRPQPYTKGAPSRSA